MKRERVGLYHHQRANIRGSSYCLGQFGSDAESSAPEGVFLLSSTHPAPTQFRRIFAKYVRQEHVLPVEEGFESSPHCRRCLSLADRGRLKAALMRCRDIRPKTFQDHSTYAKPMQFATGMTDVFINGKLH